MLSSYFLTHPHRREIGRYGISRTTGRLWTKNCFSEILSSSRKTTFYRRKILCPTTSTIRRSEYKNFNVIVFTSKRYQLKFIHRIKRNSLFFLAHLVLCRNLELTLVLLHS